MVNGIRYLAIVGIILALAASRLAPHPWNFTPVAAMALFAGAYLADRRLAFAIPLFALVLSDLLLNRSAAGDPAKVWLLCGFGYVCFALVVALGLWIGKRRTLLRIAGATLAASALFFLVSNLGYWLVFEPYTPLDILFLNALPYFRMTLAGDLLYAAVLFGGFALAERHVPALTCVHAQPTEPPAAAA